MLKFQRTALSFAMVLGAVPAFAQDAPKPAASAPSPAKATEVERVVITAERRETALQKTPISVTAVTEKGLEERTVTDAQSLATVVPGLSYNKVSNFVQLSIRGISLEQINLGGEPGVALHLDGVYLARPFVGDAVFDDLARVEVLRGPQGTLYGRNATGGSVNLIPNQPSADFAGRIGFTVGDYGRFRAAGMLNGALNDSGSVQGRISLVTDRRDGYVENLLDGRDVDDQSVYSGRAAVGVDLSDTARFVLSFDYAREDDAGPIFDVGSIAGTAPALGGRVTADKRTLFIDGPASNEITSWGVTGRLTWDIGAATLTSISAYRDSEFNLNSDLDGTDFFLINEDLNETGKQLSQELQLASNGDGALQWLLGLYAFSEEGTLAYKFPVPLFGTTITFDATQDTTALAAFGQLSYNFTDKLRGTVGLRYSHDEKEGFNTRVLFVPGSVSVEDSWSALTPRFVLDYQISDDAMVYGSVSRGFKAGGINTASLQTNAYKPELIWSYEAGLKSRFANGRVQTNLAAFYYEYTDLQVNQFATGFTFIDNAASATATGFEAEFVALVTENLRLDGSLVLLDATFDEFSTTDAFRPGLGVLDLSGNELARAPSFTGNIGLQYDHPFADGSVLTLRGDYAHRSSFFFTPFNTDYAESPATDVYNARIAYQTAGGDWTFAVFGKNLSDEVLLQTITVSGINGGTIELYAPPRTWGVEVRRSF